MSSDSFGSMNNSLNGADDSFNGSKSFASQHSVSLSSLKGSAQVVSQSMLEYLHEFRREVVLMRYEDRKQEDKGLLNLIPTRLFYDTT